MSEKTESWEKLEKILDKKLDEKLKPLFPSSEPEKHEHWKAEELINPECPECKAEKQKLRSQILKEVYAETKGLSHECTECGLGVKGEESGKEAWKCPTCGNKYAKER